MSVALHPVTCWLCSHEFSIPVDEAAQETCVVCPSCQHIIPIPPPEEEPA